MFLIFFALWVIFNGRLTWEIAWLGALISAALYALCWRFLDVSPRKDLAALRRIPKMLKYAATLLREIVKANWALTRFVLSRKAEVHPQLVTFRTPVTGPVAQSVLADSITVTPGTITVLCENDELTVHCLDRSFAEGVEDTPFQRQLLQMEGGATHDGE